ncbi:uncharacterized protein LOC132858904 isoform X2 [Tachysurus vachellii]|uniref:uncharacterized protein LOC132858904 isoform X2 n=1 Tax=Tachysurus vachellii TaxID=175792 RepID=UPI00296B046E|nr:uncharacterized protein LOC132858904 isoform X2 [Tachysurus vachellii]
MSCELILLSATMNPQPQGQPIRPGHTIWISRPSSYPRPVPSEVMAGYRRFQLFHITHELTKILDQLCSPELPEHPYLLSHIVRKPPARTSASQTPLSDLVDQRTQTDGCPHAETCCPELGTPVSPPCPSSPPLAYICPLSPALASSSSDSEPGSPVYIPSSPSPRPGSPDYTPTTPRPDSTAPNYFY